MAGEYIEFNNNSQPAINDTNLNRLQQLIKQDIQGAVSGDTLPVGAIMPFGSDTIPDNWLLCNGQAVSRTTYQELFNIIGITYGTGDGFTTFNLPDLQGKIPVGKDENDTDFDTLGETGGEKEHTLTINEMPSHNHDLSYKWTSGNGDHIGTVDGMTTTWAEQKYWEIHTTQKGGGQPHNILQPYIVQNYIIKAKQSSGVVATVVDNLTSASATNALSANQGRILNDRFNYSTTEKVVGTWIDGKPKYRKVITITEYPGTGTTNISHNIANIDEIINYDAYFYNSYVNEAHEARKMPSMWYIQMDYYMATVYWISRSEMQIHLGDFWTESVFRNAHVIVEYTKTTD